jgi:hypothetical protein
MYMRRALAVISTLLTLNQNFAQYRAQGSGIQFEIVEPRRYYYGISTNYYSRFEEFGGYRVNFEDRTLYKKNHVKKVWIYLGGAAKKPSFMCELDTAGNLIKTGHQAGEGYFIVQGSKPMDGSRATSFSAWYKDSALVRTDTFVYTNINRKERDTMFTCQHVSRKYHHRGDFLNNRNAYYNKRYLNKKLSIRQGPYISDTRPGKVIYLRRALKTNFKSDSMYLSYHIEYLQNLFTYRDSAGRQIEIKSPLPLNTGAYFYQPKILVALSGDNFQEPPEFHEPGLCASAYGEYRGTDYYRDRELVTQKNGLWDTMYVIDYKPDTAAAAVAAYKKQNDEAIANGAVRLLGENPRYPRSKDRTKRVEWFVRYEYFRE